MYYHFNVHKEKKGYWAECVELEGCFTQAENLTELKKNMEEALNSHLLEPVESHFIFPEPKKRTSKTYEPVKVRPEIAFPLLLRNFRLTKRMKQHDFKKILGFDNVFQYQRLEKIGGANPSLKTICLLKEKFPGLKITKIFD
jgi:antitoxin HicB